MVVLSINLILISDNGRMHTVQLPAGVPVSDISSRASIIDSSTVQPSMSARSQHNLEIITRLRRSQSKLECDDQECDREVAEIFHLNNSRRLTRRSRDKAVRQVCCNSQHKQNLNLCCPNNNPVFLKHLNSYVWTHHTDHIARQTNLSRDTSPPMIASVTESQQSIQHVHRPTPQYACNNIQTIFRPLWVQGYI